MRKKRVPCIPNSEKNTNPEQLHANGETETPSHVSLLNTFGVQTRHLLVAIQNIWKTNLIVDHNFEQINNVQVTQLVYI